MTIQMQSTSDTPEAVTAALGDLAPKDIPVEAKPVEAAEEIKPGDDVAEDIADEAETIEPENEDESGEEEVKPEAEEDETLNAKPKKKGGFQKRIDKLNKRVDLISQEKEYWRNQALSAKPPVETKTEPVKLSNDLLGRPKADAFETNDDYVIALADWQYDQRKARDDKKSREDSVKNEYLTKANTHKSRVEEFRKAHDDFDELVDSVKIPMPIAFQELILESDVGPELMYELAQDQAEFKRICELSPLSAAKAIGKLELKFSKPEGKTNSKPLEKILTKTPKPVSPVRARGSGVVKRLDDPSLSQSEYNRLREEQIRKRNSLGR